MKIESNDYYTIDKDGLNSLNYFLRKEFEGQTVYIKVEKENANLTCAELDEIQIAKIVELDGVRPCEECKWFEGQSLCGIVSTWPCDGCRTDRWEAKN